MIFSTTLPKTFLILKRIQPGIIINVHTRTRKLSLIPVGFESNFNFLHKVSKHPRIPTLIKIRQVEAELFQVDRQADRQRDRHNEANG